MKGEVTTLSLYKNIFLALLVFLLGCAFAAYAEQGQSASPSPPSESIAQESSFIRLGDLELVTEEYVVQEGDWLIKVLKEKGVPAEGDVQNILRLLKELNSSFRDLNMIRPGEKIVIFVKAGPAENNVSSTPDVNKSMPKAPGIEKKESKIKKAEKTPSEIPKGLPGQLKYEAYKMQPGDSIGTLAIARYGLSRSQLYNEYFPLFRECNPSIKDLNRIFVGKKVRLPLFPPVREAAPLEKTSGISDLDNASDGRVLIHPVSVGTRIPDPVISPDLPAIRPPQEAHDEDRVAPPAKKPVPSAVSKKAKKSAAASESLKKAGTIPVEIPYKPYDIGRIFTEIGSDWIDSGEHFIPLKSGGQINLKASSYPVIRLNDGVTVILDTTGELPREMRRFIQSTWEDYRIVQLDTGDDLRSALDKILKACGYKTAVKEGEPLLLGKDIRFEIRGHWILAVKDEDVDEEAKYLVLNLVSSPSEYAPKTIKGYLEKLQVHMIEYPPGANPLDAREPRGEIRRAADRFALIEALLKLTGCAFSAHEQIPAFMGQKEDFQLVINADFFVKTDTGNSVIDLTGLDPKIIAFLKKRKISVLSLVNEKDPLILTDRILGALRVKNKKGPHRLQAIHESENMQVAITMPGILFEGVDGRQVLVTPVDVPEEILIFLTRKEFGLLLLSGFPPSGSPSVERK